MQRNSGKPKSLDRLFRSFYLPIPWTQRKDLSCSSQLWKASPSRNHLPVPSCWSFEAILCLTTWFAGERNSKMARSLRSKCSFNTSLQITSIVEITSLFPHVFLFFFLLLLCENSYFGL